MSKQIIFSIFFTVLFVVPILTNAQTVLISDNATGGDCIFVGNWNIATKTCVLTTDINETIQIDDNNITLDGDNHTITGTNTGSGVYLYQKTNVTIKNLNIRNFFRGIYLVSSDNNTIADNTVSNNISGINIYQSDDNTIENNITGFNVYYGISSQNGDRSIIKGNNTFNNKDGIYLLDSSNNIINKNNISDNSSAGVNIQGYVLGPQSNNVVSENNIFNNLKYGIILENTSGEQIINNNFVDNQTQSLVYNSIDNIFNLFLPTGGNYWSDFDEPAEGCNDANFDGFCDAPYIFTGGQDNLPWTKKDGWEAKTLSEESAELAKELVNQPGAYLWGGKGWDYNLAKFVPSANVLSGYTYWNPNLSGFDTGIGVDCSGLITWAFNRAFDAFMPAVNNFVKYVNANGLYSDFQSDAVAEAELLPGDAMFFDWDGDGYIDHTAMYVGENGGYDVVNARSRELGIRGMLKNKLRNIDEFVDFRRIHEGNIAMQITAGSPVDLTVSDPDDFTITSDSVISSEEEYIREIPGTLYYLEMEQSSDGSPIDRVYSPVLKTGDYLINVVPEPDALATDTFSLSFTAGATTTLLAENVPISDIPSQPYIVRTSEKGFEKIIPAQIRIKPETINLKSRGVFTVFLQIEPGFGVSINDIATSTIMLAGAQPIKTFVEMEDIINSSEKKDEDKRYKDDNYRHKHKNDGDNDENDEDDEVLTLIAKFCVKDLVDISVGKNVPLLFATQLLDGTKIEGSDTVRVIDKGKHHKHD